MRVQLLKKITLAFFLVLFLGLGYTQIVRGGYYLQLSQNNRIKLIRLPARRGLIYDRWSEVIAGSRMVFNAAILTEQAKDIEQIISQISPILNISEKQLLQRYKRDFQAPFIPVVVAQDIPKQQAIILECQEIDIPGLVIQTEPVRDYRYPDALGHIFGYLGRISAAELQQLKPYGLQAQDLVGRSGIEEQFDSYLRGQAGGMQVEVNNRGHKVRVLGARPAQEGGRLYLTIDSQLQQFVDSQLQNLKGACIVLNPQNGEILAMVSKPNFDPNLFISALKGSSTVIQKISRLLNSPEAVLLNRAISGSYVPGSIFKIVVAAAALEQNRINPQDSFHCPGSFQVGNREFFCWNLDGHGSVNLEQALAYSCNVFFYKLALKLGPDCIAAMARKFGLGNPTGVDLPYETSGLVPSQSWKLMHYRERWYDGETANFAIGQGYLLCSPLQIAQMIAAVANGGYLVQPHIIKKTEQQTSPIQRKNIGLQPQTLRVLKQGMYGAIQDIHGTAHKASIPGATWAAKTGTAQAANGKPHGWFGGFYPFAHPGVVILVFLEHGGSGGEAPAVIAKRIVEYVQSQ